MTELNGTTVLVTGATSGIGKAMATELARRGANIAVYGRNRDRLDAVTTEIRQTSGVKAIGVVCDVADRARVYQAITEVEQQLGPVEVLINNAGVVSGKTLAELTDDEIETVIATNVLSLYWVTRSVLPQMIARGSGHIVTIASVAGLLGVNKQTDYAASKHAAHGFAESLRMELAAAGHTGIKTTLINPYYVATGMFKGAKTPFPRLLPILKPDDVAHKAIAAIRRDTKELTMPPVVRLLPALRVLPTAVFDAIVERFGVNSSMEQFVGHQPTGGDSG
ncbi:MAG: SDR family oxidoreductase [Mycobacterium sp.]|uniref:SDR family oxidoreductase n=1 Tax=Mycobacterium sp. TaxID=1785 RepID=UPI003CC526B7